MPIPFIQENVKPSVNELRLDLAHFFPELTHFYGYAAGPDHNTKRCLDAMVYDSSNKYVGQQGRSNLPYSQRIALGNRILAHLKKNAEHYGLNGVIWNGKVYGFPHSGGTNNYRGPYGVARNYALSKHDDHLHIDQDGSSFTPLRTVTPVVPPIGTVWVDLLVAGVTNSTSIRLVQKALGAPETGTYDAATIDAAKAYQASLGDGVDGWLGPKQVTRLFADKGMSVTIRLDASGQAPKPVPPVVKPPVVKPPVTPQPTPPTDTKPEPAVTHTVTVAGFNILRETDTLKGRERWPERRPDVIKHLKAAKASVALLCEVDKSTCGDVADGLGWSYYPSGFNTGKEFSPLGILWDPNVWRRDKEAFVEEYSDNENRFLMRLPLIHKASGKEVWFYSSHLENDGDTATDGHKARKVETTEWARWTLDGPGVFYADLNSTTRSGESATTREREKPRPILKGAGWKFLTDQAGVTNRQLETHHGGLSRPSDNGPWIDDMGFKGVTYVKGALIRTDGTDASDHNLLSITIKL